MTDRSGKCRENLMNIYCYTLNNWIIEYTEERPHSSLGRLTSKEFGLANSKEYSNIYWY